MEKENLVFIKDCVRNRDILWTYHVNMRLNSRFISREEIINSFDSYEIIESYEEDKYLPSFLVYATYKGNIFHILFAVDRINNNVRIITAYKPDKLKWNEGFKIRRKK